VGHAFVDWDDTIAENIRYFNQVEEANAHLIARLTGTDPAVVRRRGQEIDVATARRMGLVRESLSTAWVECYLEFCAGVRMTPSVETEDAIRRACRLPYETRQELLPGAAETLGWLHESGFEVTIWTAGDPEVQKRKVRESGLAGLVHRAEVVLDKTPERLAAVIGERERGRCFVVGNSVHSDIRPALAVGVLAVHVPAETWAYDHGRLDLSDPNYRMVERITEVSPLLSDLFGVRRSLPRTGEMESAG
jgi:putative hydrolase of the HAD superfamily